MWKSHTTTKENDAYPQSTVNLPGGVDLPHVPWISDELDSRKIEELVDQLKAQIPEGMGGAPINLTPSGNATPVVDQGILLPADDTTLRNLLSDLDPPAAPAVRMSSTPGYYFLTDAVRNLQPPYPSDAFDVISVRRDFPILQQKVHGRPLIYLDNAATSQKPQSVIDAEAHFYQRDNSNVHRGVHTLASRATAAYEGARAKVQRFLYAKSDREIIFVRNTTEAINLVAQTYGRQTVQAGDEIILTTLEHHSNIVPWQLLCKEKCASLRVVPLNDRGEVILEAYEALLGPRTRMVAISHVSNALGTVVPVQTMIQMAHRHGAHVLVDGAQATPHFRVNVQELDADFYALSGHKVFGPTGIGVLYGKADLLEDMPPWQGGGGMIEKVTFEETTYQQPPERFEAGTGNLAGAVGLGAAIDYLEQIGFEVAELHERALLSYATNSLLAVPGLRLIGTAQDKVGVLSFILAGARPDDVGHFLDGEGIAVRAGHHCAQPALQRFGLTATVRASLAFYNTREEIDALVAALVRYTRL